MNRIPNLDACNPTPWIDDSMSLSKVVNHFGRDIKTYDDAFGPLWVFRQSWAVEGVVRAQSWETAYEIVEDEILTPIPVEDVIEAFGFYVVPEYPLSKDKGKWFAHTDGNVVPLATFSSEADACAFCEQQIAVLEIDLVEGYSYQSNATGTGIVQHDLNGESLDLLTPELAKDLELTVVFGKEHIDT